MVHTPPPEDAVDTQKKENLKSMFNVDLEQLKFSNHMYWETTIRDTCASAHSGWAIDDTQKARSGSTASGKQNALAAIKNQSGHPYPKKCASSWQLACDHKRRVKYSVA